MTLKDIAVIIIGAVIGGSGFVGLAFFLLRHYIENKLTFAEDEAAKRKATRITRMKIEDELHHAYGRLLFWIYRAIVTSSHNGELDTAFQALEAVEEKKRAFDRDIRAESEQD